MGWTDLAAGLRRELQRFPADLGARIALVRVEAARNDGDAFASGFGALLPLLNGGADRFLAWDRRVSLATLLAQGQRPDLAEIQAAPSRNQRSPPVPCPPPPLPLVSSPTLRRGTPDLPSAPAPTLLPRPSPA
jgi:hypothetical protein